MTQTTENGLLKTFYLSPKLQANLSLPDHGETLSSLFNGKMQDKELKDEVKHGN